MYEYALHRSLKNEGAPKGYTSHRKANKALTWKYRHGVVGYQKPVTRDKMLDHRLTPLTQSDPRFMESIYEMIYDDIMTQLNDGDNRYVTNTDGGKTAVVEYSFVDGPKKGWGLRQYNSVGNEVGKIIIKRNTMDLAPFLWKMFSAKRKKTYIDIIAVDI